MRAFDWWNTVTTEMYLNTNRQDWWFACEKLASEILGVESLLDVGSGDGHTLWQILSVAANLGGHIKNVTTLEPSLVALERAQIRLNRLSLEKSHALNGPFGNAGEVLIEQKIHFDVLTVIHANYHFGKTLRTVDVERYYFELSLLPRLAKKVVIMTTSGKSDYYKMLEHDPFGPHVYAESVVEFYQSRGFTVQVIDAQMRFYVAHALLCPDEAKLLWQFFNDSSRFPSAEELKSFKQKVAQYMDQEGNINFRDKIIVVT